MCRPYSLRIPASRNFAFRFLFFPLAEDIYSSQGTLHLHIICLLQIIILSDNHCSQASKHFVLGLKTSDTQLTFFLLNFDRISHYGVHVAALKMGIIFTYKMQYFSLNTLQTVSHMEFRLGSLK